MNSQLIFKVQKHVGLGNKGVRYLCAITLIIYNLFSDFEYIAGQDAVWHLHDSEALCHLSALCV